MNANSAEPGAVTQLLNQWGKGDRAAFDQLLPLVYRELHKIAKRCLAQHEPNRTLQTTAVVHEAYLKLAGGAGQGMENRTHFLAVAARAMRHVILDYARNRRAAKRGGGIRMEPFEDGLTVAIEPEQDVFALDAALSVLARSYPATPKSSSCATSAASAWRR